MDKQELFTRARDAIVDADEAKAIELIHDAVKSDVDLLELLLSGFGAGNEEIGDRFDIGALSLPELIYAAEVMKSVTNTILEMLKAEGEDTSLLESKGRILLATVEGDVHDIGKGIVATTLKAAGFEVIDLGCEVPTSMILEKAKEYDVDIIGTSALLTSTMPEQKNLEKLLIETGDKNRFITMVGGAPCTPRWARKIGAGAYSGDAIEAVKVAQDLMNKKHGRTIRI